MGENQTDYRQHYTEEYFRKWNYSDRGLGRFSMYWFARRYYAALIRRYAPPGGGKLLEMGCGLGHLLRLLQDDFDCVGIDRAAGTVGTDGMPVLDTTSNV